jgi:REP element-mobilizing transposase RayT
MPHGLHRYYGANQLLFITFSCHRRTPLLRSARSRDCILSVLEKTRERYRFVVVGYVVMPEHVHLLISEHEVGTPSTVMQVLKRGTARALLPKAKRGDPRQVGERYRFECLRRERQNPTVQSEWFPPFAKTREGWGTRFCFGADKGWATRPINRQDLVITLAALDRPR